MTQAGSRGQSQPFPAGHPHGKPAPQDRRAARQSRHARRHRLLADVALSARIPVRSARHRTARAIWYPILYGLVLTTRPQKSGANYAKIWNREKDESPLRTFTRGAGREACCSSRRPAGHRRRLGHALRQSIDQERGRADGSDQGCDRILTLPLYPQYSATTTATANDKLFRALMKMRRAPAVRSVPPYYDDPVYIDALALRSRQHLATLDFEPEVVHRLLPRHSETLFRERRSLSLPLPEDDAAAARKAWLGRARS